MTKMAWHENYPDYDAQSDVCGNCHFAEHKKKDWCLCFRFPPVQYNKDANSVSPDVHVTRRACGEFKHKDVAKVRTPHVR